VNRAIGNFILTDEQEVSLGADMAAQIEMETTVHPDADVQAFLDAVAGKVLGAVPAKKKRFDFQFTVLQSDQVNAFAIPGGRIYFYSQLICLADTEAQVAAVMGHEIAHVTEDHVSQSLAAQLGTSVLLSLALGEDPGQLAELAAGVAQAGYLATYSQESESEADRVGLAYLDDAGYAPTAMAEFFEKLAALRASDPNVLDSFFASHPDPEERAGVVRSIITEEGLGPGQPSQVGDLAAVKTKIGC
jgi:predicted Zn-dependent protease